VDVQVKEIINDVPLTVHLTERESEILLFLSKGMSNKEIAYMIKRSRRLVHFHQISLYSKLSASNSCEAVANAFRLGILT
jgi:DNA-binding NarL/FixJ family response regulator